MMRSPTSSIRSFFALLASGLALSACSVVGSSPVAEISPALGYAGDGSALLRCNSKLGSYSLPKSLLQIKVSRLANGRHQIEFPSDVPVRVPENRHTYCLDHLSTGFADDTIRVLKDEEADRDSATVGTKSS
ncbi:MAG: hypothetical protein RID59_18970, partial [Hoeflea sp.]